MKPVVRSFLGYFIPPRRAKPEPFEWGWDAVGVSVKPFAPPAHVLIQPPPDRPPDSMYDGKPFFSERGPLPASPTCEHGDSKQRWCNRIRPSDNRCCADVQVELDLGLRPGSFTAMMSLNPQPLPAPEGVVDDAAEAGERL